MCPAGDRMNPGRSELRDTTRAADALIDADNRADSERMSKQKESKILILNFFKSERYSHWRLTSSSRQANY